MEKFINTSFKIFLIVFLFILSVFAGTGVYYTILESEIEIKERQLNFDLDKKKIYNLEKESKMLDMQIAKIKAEIKNEQINP